jgi:hypothetical protein
MDAMRVPSSLASTTALTTNTSPTSAGWSCRKTSSYPNDLIEKRPLYMKTSPILPHMMVDEPILSCDDRRTMSGAVGVDAREGEPRIMECVAVRQGAVEASPKE